MKITEYENNLTWNPPLLSCDKAIHNQIREPLPTTSFFMAFAGAAGSGKTSAAIAWLTHKEMYNKVFTNIYVVMPKNSRMSLAGDPFKKHAEERLFDDLSADVLQTVLSNCESESSEGHHSLLFIDDCGSALKNNTIQKLLKKLIFNRRHLKLSIMILCQSYQSMPLDIRKNISHLVMFKPRNKKELEILFDELVFLPKDQQVLLNNHVFDTPHNFLFVNTGNGKLYKNFNQLEIEF